MKKAPQPVARQQRTRHKVPPFQQYFPSKESMRREQRQFYESWLRHWLKEKPLDVQGNISYLFCYVYEILSLPPRDAACRLLPLISAYPTEELFVEYCKRWLSDCYVFLADYRKALAVYPPVSINARGVTCTDHLLSLKLKINEHIAGRDILSLNGPRVTKWGKEHLNDVATYLNISVIAYEKHNNLNLIKKWSRSSYKYAYSVFRGTEHSTTVNIPCYSFSSNEAAVKFSREIMREAENSVREEMNVPHVGEGWIGETELYYAIKDAIPEIEVIQHARPDWLGRQHLDVFIPEYAVALEYQGAQHDEPIEYFGGVAAYRATMRRDTKKKRICTENGISLIDVRPGYKLKEILKMIDNFSAG